MKNSQDWNFNILERDRCRVCKSSIKQQSLENTASLKQYFNIF